MKFLLTALAAAALTFAAPASAATFITELGPAADGSLTWIFGDGSVAAGPFTDLFSVLFPDNGDAAGSVTASFTSPDDDLSFLSVSFDATPFTLFSGPGLHGGNLAPIPVTSGPHTLTIAGLSPGVAGAYVGHLTFTPSLSATVPEPSAWALMIAGFGLLGAGMRWRRQREAPAG